MQDTYTFDAKRVFSAVVAAATIAFSVGAGALVAPHQAAAASAGDIFRGTTLSTVYYYGFDGDRHVFPNVKTYETWYGDFSEVKFVADSVLDTIALSPKNVVVRPGAWWVKIDSVNKVYAVAANGQMHWIESEQVAKDFAGSDWSKRIIDIPDALYGNYNIGTSLMTAKAYEGALVANGGKTWLVQGGSIREVTPAGMTANRFASKFILDGGNVDISGLTVGTPVTAREANLVDAAQGATTTAPVGGSVSVSRASSMPAGASVPKSANSVEVFSFDVQAGSSASTVDGVTLSLAGIGSTSNISNVYIYQGNKRLTDARSVNSSTRKVTFSNLGVKLAAGEKATLSARVEVSSSASAADTFGFNLASSSDVTAGGAVSGSFPVSGNIFTVASQAVGAITIAKNGTVSNPSLGQQDAKIAEFKLTAGTEAVDVRSLILNIDDAVDHSDYRLLQGTTVVANGARTTGDSVLFTFATPYFIDEGNNRTFTVTADVGGQSTDTVKVALDNAVDLYATGRDYGFGQSVTSTNYADTGSACSGTGSNCSYSTIQGGDVTFTFNGPSAGNIQTDSQDQQLLKFSMRTEGAVTIKDLDILVYGDDDDNDALDGTDDATDNDDDGLIVGSGTNEAAITDIKIKNADTGAVLWGPLELDGVADSDNDGVQTIDFTEDLFVAANTTLNLVVTADVDDNVTSGTEFAAALDVSGLSIEDDQGDALTLGTDIVPNSDINGYNHQAISASFAVALASSATDVATIKGAKNVVVNAFTFTAGNASDARVSEISVNVYGDDDNDASFTAGGETNADVNTFVERCSLYEGTSMIGSAESPNSAGTDVTFDNLSWVVDAGEVTTLTLKCDFANVTPTATAAFAFDVDEADVTADDEDGDSIDVTGDDVNGGTSATNVVTLTSAGSLAITASASTPSADFVLTGSADNHVAAYRVTATNEAFNIETLSFSEEQAEDDTGSSDSAAYANNVSTVKVTYPKADGTTGTKTASMSGNEVKFSNLDMYVPVGSPKTVNVYVSVSNTDRDAGGSATSNEKLRLGLFVDTTNDDNLKAIGAASGSTLDDDDIGAVGDDAQGTDGIATFVVRETKPTVAVASNTPSGTKAPGRQETLSFNVSAAANEDVVLKQIIFQLSSTDAATSNWNICDTDDAGVAITAADFDLYNFTVDGTSSTLEDQNSGTWTIHGADGTVCGTTANGDVTIAKLSLSTPEVVPAGSTTNFKLYFDSTGASAASDDVVRFDIPTDPIATSFLAGSDLNESNVAATDTTITVTSGAAYSVGDVVCMDTADNNCGSTDEKMLVTAISTNDLTVVRGYLGTTPDTSSANDAADDLDRLPSAFLWQDDGSTSTSTSNQEYWGAYLVDNLLVSGGTLVF